MKQWFVRWVAAFLIGFAGWLAAGALRLEDGELWVAAVAVGVIAAAAARRLVAWPALLLGMIASYPTALVLGVIAFLGENWAIYAVLFLMAASAGFGGWLLAARAVQILRPRPT